LQAPGPPGKAATPAAGATPPVVQGKQPPFRGGQRGRRLLLAGQRRPWDTVSPDTRESAKAGVGPVVISDVLIASSATGTVLGRDNVAAVDQG
jgi:hypothetical protein